MHRDAVQSALFDILLATEEGSPDRAEALARLDAMERLLSEPAREEADPAA